MREIKVLQRIRHKNIVLLKEIITDKGNNLLFIIFLYEQELFQIKSNQNKIKRFSLPCNRIYGT